MTKTAQIMSDALTSVPRGAVTSMLQNLAEADPDAQADMTSVMNTIIANPDAFTNKEMNRMNTAINAGTFGDTVDIMMRQPDFRERMVADYEPFKPDFSKLSGMPMEKPTNGN